MAAATPIEPLGVRQRDVAAIRANANCLEGWVAGAATFGKIQTRLGLGPSAAVGALTLAAGMAVYPMAFGGLRTAAMVMLIGALISTIGIVWADIALGAVLAQEVPDGLRARVGGAYRTVNFGVRPVGALIGGLLGAALDLRATLAFSALGAICGAALRLRKPIRHLRLADPA